MNRDDAIRIRHMLDNLEAAERFCEGKGREDLDTDLMFAYALVRAMELIGEAATKVSRETRAANPDIPWNNIVGIRHRLIHG